MGTNFYVRKDVCPTCKHSKKELHIGKRSGGWKFGWRGHKDHQPPIVSRADWFEFFKQPDIQIVDEYDQPLTVQEFIDMVTSWDASPHNTQNHYDYVRKPENSYWSSGEHASDTWRDPEGFNFTGTEFS